MKNESGVSIPVHLAESGRLREARAAFTGLLGESISSADRAQTLNNLAAVEVALGDEATALRLLNEAATIAPNSRSVQHNIAFLRACGTTASQSRQVALASETNSPESSNGRSQATRIAIVSMLFNWPSTGGGTVHTKELAQSLANAGYEVRHFYAVHNEWGVGQVPEPVPYPAEALVFAAHEWESDQIRHRFRIAVESFDPDYVIITDSWNTKPLLAEAVSEFPYFIRIAALESLCPLNNVRLLVDHQGLVRQCDQNQLANPSGCRDCVDFNGRLSGGLHQAERVLAGFGEDSYAERLRSAFANAEGVLVVNPEIGELVKPFSKGVHVIPSGFDRQRFPAEFEPPPSLANRKNRILFAGLVHEFMKGFHVLQEAGADLWRERQDFEIWATADPIGQMNEFTRYVGWQSQESLPRLISECDALVFPTIAQEALGRTAVEAMACGRPVVASRIGGLSWVVEEGVTGLLCEPGNASDLAAKGRQLLDDADLRQRLGRAGRQKFEREFTWEVVLEQYARIFGLPLHLRSERVGANPRSSPISS